MARRDEYLVIDAVGVRHRLRLPSVLRRCIVTRARWHGGELTDGTLEVEFRPDPGQWPREDDGRRVAGRPHPREGGR